MQPRDFSLYGAVDLGARQAAAQRLGGTEKLADRYLTMVSELINVPGADLGLDGDLTSQ